MFFSAQNRVDDEVYFIFYLKISEEICGYQVDDEAFWEDAIMMFLELNSSNDLLCLLWI